MKKLERNKKIQGLINEAISHRAFRMGLTRKEIVQLCMKLKCQLKEFDKSFGVNTIATNICTMCGQLEGIYYCCDVELAFAKIYKYRVVRYEEWD